MAAFDSTLEKLKPKIVKKTDGNSSESIFLVFMNDMDNFVNSLPSNFDHIGNSKSKKLRKIVEQMNVEKSQAKQEKILTKLLTHSGIPLEKLFFQDLHHKFKNHLDKNLQSSVQIFLAIIVTQIISNGGNYFYISNSQVEKFFGLGKTATFDLQNKFFQDYVDSTYYLSRDFFASINFLGNTFIADKRATFYKNSIIFLRKGLFPSWAKKYSIGLRERYYLRKPFLAFTTIINKIFCNGAQDFENLFLKHQVDAVDFYDEIWKNLKLDSNSNISGCVLYIENFDSILNKEQKDKLLKTFNMYKDYIENNKKLQMRVDNKNRARFSALWRFIALWLACKRIDLLETMFLGGEVLINKFKSFITSIVCIIIFNKKFVKN
ncbi:hypothetical protein BY996DRAFT_1690447 [Phakopsora pachyrhizi]|nr:hypothetical protein BY996DRAFT_1690447 [Phakopsora pachyrhizi]